MEIIGFCHNCGKEFDAHWHNYPELSPIKAAMEPYCLHCKSLDVHTMTDESNDPMYDETEYDYGEDEI